MSYEINPIFIKTKTNLHVGNGDINYDVVDKTVQRDTISEVPIINASSLKGAIKDHMGSIKLDKGVLSNDLEHLEDDAFVHIFGEEYQGLIKFLDSYLLFLPLRSSTKPFYHVTSKANLEMYIEFLEGVRLQSDKLDKLKTFVKSLDENKDIVLDNQDSQIEDIECASSSTNTSALLELFPPEIRPKNIAIFSNTNFLDAVKHLPVIARNALDNEGKSQNLWYEEIVPRESILYTALLDYNNFGNSSARRYQKGFEAFYNLLQQELIQVGANASIGFGLCRFKTMEL